MRNLDINVVMLPAVSAEISIEKYTASSTGKECTSKQLYKLTMTALNMGVASFVFVKKDGSFRKAVGTLNPNTIPLEKKSAMSDKSKPDGNKQNFYDLQINEFRSFEIDSIVALIMF